ncbi:unnamed protein product [Lota lota]
MAEYVDKCSSDCSSVLREGPPPHHLNIHLGWSKSSQMGSDLVEEAIHRRPEVSDAAADVVLVVGVQQEISGEPQQVEAALVNTEDLRMCVVMQPTSTPQE